MACFLAAMFVPGLRSDLWAQTLAFPGAEGFGRFASGGRGGDVYIVTNLNDSGPGSLRDAVANRTAATPRTVVFAVSGTIYLNSTLRITQGNLTIAGQTAPGDGICLARYTLNPSNATNVIIRFIRSRLGDTMNVEDDAFMCRYASNMIVDHCSFSWSVDETFSAYDNTNFTLQWSMITESLRDSVHSKGAHGYGGIWGGLGASFHHNLMAHHDSRNPRFNGARTHNTGGELVDMRNNVIYNWRGNSTYGGEPTDAGLPARHNMINNIYKNGPATSTGTSRYRILEPSQNTAAPAGATYSLFHVSGNWTTASSTVTANNWSGGVQVISSSLYSTIRAVDPFVAAPVATQSAQEAYALVLAYAGCRLPARDAIDARIVGEVTAGTFTFRGSKGNLAGIIDSQADVGGWPALASVPPPVDTDKDGMPDAWEIAQGLNPNLASDRNLVDPASGYTRLELYLNELAAPAFPVPVVETQPQSQSVALGTAISLTVGASGPGPLSYQWYRDQAPIDGATSAVYAVSAATVGDAGVYRAVVSNAYGATSSSSAEVLLVAQPPSITTEPVAVTAAVGATASFSVVAVGSAPLTYQWFRGATSLNGQTTSALTLGAVQLADAGDYRVVVSNPYGSKESAVASLTVLTQSSGRVFETDFSRDTIHAAEPVFTTTSTNWYVMASKVATVSNLGDDPATSGVVEARPFTLGLNAGSSAANYQAATRFAVTPVALTEIGSRLRVQATLTTANNINLGFGLFNSGGSLPNTLHHSGTAATLLGGTEGIDGGVRRWVGYRALFNHASTNAAFLTRLAQTTSEGSLTNRTQDLVVPGSGSTSYGQPAGISIGTVTNATAAFTPVADTVYTLVFEVERSGGDELTLAYRLHAGAGVEGAVVFAVSGVTTAAGARPSAVTSAFDSFALGARTTNGALPRIVVTSFLVDHSAPAVVAAPQIVSEPQSLAINQGAPANFAVEATGSPTPTYQWFKNGEVIPNATSAAYAIAAAQPVDAGSYTCVVTNSAGSITSAIATLVVRTAPEFSQHPAGVTLVRGEVLTLTAAASGTPAPAYQWYRGDAAIPGAVTATLTLESVSLADAGSYTLVATNVAGVRTSEPALVVVLTPFESWALDNALTGPEAALEADVAGDGLPNLLKFVLGGDPRVAGSAPVPVLERMGDGYRYTYTVRPEAETDYLVVVEKSVDLSSWTNVVPGQGNAVLVETMLENNHLRRELTLPAEQGRLFLRLRVSGRP